MVHTPHTNIKNRINEEDSCFLIRLWRDYWTTTTLTMTTTVNISMEHKSPANFTEWDTTVFTTFYNAKVATHIKTNYSAMCVQTENDFHRQWDWVMKGWGNILHCLRQWKYTSWHKLELFKKNKNKNKTSGLMRLLHKERDEMKQEKVKKQLEVLVRSKFTVSLATQRWSVCQDQDSSSWDHEYPQRVASTVHKATGFQDVSINQLIWGKKYQLNVVLNV